MVDPNLKKDDMAKPKITTESSDDEIVQLKGDKKTSKGEFECENNEKMSDLSNEFIKDLQCVSCR